VHPPVRAGWVKELRQDVVDATLLAVLQNKRVAVDRQTAAAAARGWKHLSFVAGQLDRMDQGPAL
jgi:hypothetical protein